MPDDRRFSKKRYSDLEKEYESRNRNLVSISSVWLSKFIAFELFVFLNMPKTILINSNFKYF